MCSHFQIRGFIQEKLDKKEKLTQRDHDKLEFYNIAKTFRYIKTLDKDIKILDTNLIKLLHRMLTDGLDVFNDHLDKFDVYKSGTWRDNDEIIIGDHSPPSYKEVEDNIEFLITWLKENSSITNITKFHTTMYALHPFNNGNKRICRILEHFLFGAIGLNSSDLYSTSYYYHTQKKKYIKMLYHVITKQNLTFFSLFIKEALIFSILGVYKTSLEFERDVFIKRSNVSDRQYNIRLLLIKNKELQFSNMRKRVKKKMALQTFVNELKALEKANIINKRTGGKLSFYSLNTDILEESVYVELLDIFKERGVRIPEEYSTLI